MFNQFSHRGIRPQSDNSDDEDDCSPPLCSTISKQSTVSNQLPNSTMSTTTSSSTISKTTAGSINSFIDSLTQNNAIGVQSEINPLSQLLFSKLNIQVNPTYQNIPSSNPTENDDDNEQKNLICTPRQYQKDIYNQIRNKNSIIFMETGKGKTLISIMLINKIFHEYKLKIRKTQPKVIFLVCDLALISQQMKEIELNTKLRVNSLKGRNSKKSKSDFNEFQELLRVTDVFVAIPAVLYKLLSIGFIKITEISLIIFDECHHCDSNHAYNLIMNDFYFFYLLEKNYKREQLPQILGLTASPLKKKISMTIEATALKAMTEICENLDAQMVIDPELLENNHTIITKDLVYSDGKDYIETQDHTKNPKFDYLFTALNELIFKPILKLCLKKDDSFINTLNISSFNNSNSSSNSNNYSFNSNSGYSELNREDIEKEYLKLIHQKFYSPNFAEYIRQSTKNQLLSSLKEYNVLFKIFERLQRNIFMLIENLNFYTLYLFFQKYEQIYHQKLNEDLITDSTVDSVIQKDIELLQRDEIKSLYEIFNICMQGLTRLFQTGYDYSSDRLIKLQEKLLQLFQENRNSKIIIFVSNRIVAHFLEELVKVIIKQINPKYDCVSVIGINGKKTENNSIFDPKNTLQQLNDKIAKFNSDQANILIGTSTVEEGLDIQSCNIVMVYTELNTAKSYIQMKGRARKEKAKFLAFTDNKEETIQKIREFIQLGECMKKLFDDNIVRDFKRMDYLKKKKRNEYYYVETTEAKLTLRNISSIYSEILQGLNNKNKKVDVVKHFEQRQNSQKQKCFKCSGSYKGNFIQGGNINFSSNWHSDKTSAENDMYLRFAKYLHTNGIIDDHFKINS